MPEDYFYTDDKDKAKMQGILAELNIASKILEWDGKHYVCISRTDLERLLELCVQIGDETGARNISNALDAHPDRRDEP